MFATIRVSTVHEQVEESKNTKLRLCTGVPVEPFHGKEGVSSSSLEGGSSAIKVIL